MLADVRFTLDIPEERVEAALRGTVFEGTRLGDESDTDREQIGEHLDEWVADHLMDLLDLMTNSAPEVECDW